MLIFLLHKILAIFAVVDTLFEQIISQLRSLLLHSLMQFSFYRGNTKKVLVGNFMEYFFVKMYSKNRKSAQNFLRIISLSQNIYQKINEFFFFVNFLLIFSPLFYNP